MNVQHYEQVPAAPVEMEGFQNCQIRVLVGQREGAPTFMMRQFEVAPGGYTPKHFHDFEHEVFVLEGSGVAMEGNDEHPLAAGDVVFIRPNEVHQFRNTSNQPLKFLCLIPNSAAGKQVTVAANEGC